MAPLLESFATEPRRFFGPAPSGEPPAQATSSVVTAFALLERSCGQHPFGNPATTPARRRTRSGLCEPAFRPVSPFEDEEAQQALSSLADPVTRRRTLFEKAPMRPKPLYHDPKAVFTPQLAQRHCACTGNLVRFGGVSNRVGGENFKDSGKFRGLAPKSRAYSSKTVMESLVSSSIVPRQRRTRSPASRASVLTAAIPGLWRHELSSWRQSDRDLLLARHTTVSFHRSRLSENSTIQCSMSANAS